MNCAICGNDWFEWTDLHGEAICGYCGVPHQLIQYDENGKMIKAPPVQVNIKAEYMPLLSRYWEEKHQHMGLGTYLGYTKYPERAAAFYEWLEKQPGLPPTLNER
jgi:hypothetical protein